MDDKEKKGGEVERGSYERLRGENVGAERWMRLEGENVGAERRGG